MKEMEQLLGIVRDNEDDGDAVKVMRKLSRPLLDFALRLLVRHLRGKLRYMNRLAHKQLTIRFYELARGGPGYYAKVPKTSEREVERTSRLADDFFLDYKIGNTPLGEFTKEMLIAEAAREERAGEGHFLNVRFYRRLAEPLNDEQLVPEYWSAHAVGLLREEIWRGSDTKLRQATPLSI